MIDQRQELGAKGEELAVRLLENKGHQILHKNYRNKLGEIDIISQDKDCLCFVEVRTKTASTQGHPLESINFKKQRKLSQVASLYLAQQGLQDAFARFDCIGVTPTENGEFQLQYCPNAFEAII